MLKSMRNLMAKLPAAFAAVTVRWCNPIAMVMIAKFGSSHYNSIKFVILVNDDWRGFLFALVRVCGIS
jgi:hypothetical protein